MANVARRNIDRMNQLYQIGRRKVAAMSMMDEWRVIAKNFLTKSFKEYFEIELECGKKINITGEHPVLTGRSWIRVDELLITDEIVCVEDVQNA